MSQYSQWIEYKGKKMLFNNFAGMKTEDLAKYQAESMQVLANQPDKRPLVVTDVSGTFTNAEITETGKKGSEMLKAKGIEPIVSLVGITGAKKVLASVVMRSIHFANTVEEAKEWLAKQEK